MLEINSKLEQYILTHSDDEPEVLQKLFRDTHVHIYHPRMLSGHLQGRVLKILCEMINPENVLEIGTYTGYSAICFAEALKENGMIHSIEINDELEDFINKHIYDSGLKDKIRLYFGDALEIIPEMNITFDLVFIDGDKKQYIEYYQTVFEKLKKGGYIIADNVLWDGKVIDERSKQDEQTKAMVDFNTFVKQDKRVENVIFPIRDGIMVIRKK